MKKVEKQKAGISDATVLAATGKKWDAWYTILDKAKATSLSHTEIARYLYIHYLKNNGWWCQMIANRYEQTHGLRKKYQSKDGFEISVSVTISVNIFDVYAAWMNEKKRNSWLKEKGFEITNVTPNTSILIRWNDSITRVSVRFYEKGPLKSQVVVEHSKLVKESSVAEKKLYWKKKLSKLSALLTKN